MLNNENFFSKGYDKGRSDGIKHAMMVLRIAIDYYPSDVPPTAREILPDEDGRILCAEIKAFGELRFRQGKKHQKEYQKAKDDAQKALEPEAHHVA